MKVAFEWESVGHQIGRKLDINPSFKKEKLSDRGLCVCDFIRSDCQLEE